MKSTNKLFWLPDDIGFKTRVIQAVPNNWLWINGHLQFPANELNLGQVASNTGFYLSRYNNQQPAIVGKSSPSGLRVPPDLTAIMVDRKMPGFVVFETAGYGSELDFVRMRDLVVEYVRLGYLGWVDFYLRDHGNYYYDNPARCKFHFRQPEEGPSDVTLEVNEKFGGKLADVEPIRAVCAELNLVEPYQPR